MNSLLLGAIILAKVACLVAVVLLYAAALASAVYMLRGRGRQ